MSNTPAEMNLNPKSDIDHTPSGQQRVSGFITQLEGILGPEQKSSQMWNNSLDGLNADYLNGDSATKNSVVEGVTVLMAKYMKDLDRGDIRAFLDVFRPKDPSI